ncbi:MAG: hypothetical protein COA52_00625 [Hyphomicrobiales bacterium]|nr:MAG: hypothetical protein COA52_00625 [Hyphomicrobiales bacterium]
MKWVIILGVFLSLNACSDTLIAIKSETNSVIVTPPNNLYNCPQLRRIPNPETLTNQQVADTIGKLYKYNKICKINMNNIKKFVNEAKILNKNS